MENDVDKAWVVKYFERIIADLNDRLNERFRSSETAIQFALTEREKAVNAALIAADKAVNKAEETAKETLKSHNDLIRQSRDRDATYATHSDLSHTNADLKKLETFQSKILGAIAFGMVFVPLITALSVYLLTR